ETADRGRAGATVERQPRGPRIAAGGFGEAIERGAAGAARRGGPVTGAVYMDSSALLKLVALEPESAALQAHLRDRPIQVASSIVIVELGRSLARNEELDPTMASAVIGRLVLVDADRRIMDRAAGLVPAALRSLDAIHLATAIEVRDSIEAVVTYDGRLASAARIHGFEVVAPA